MYPIEVFIIILLLLIIWNDVPTVDKPVYAFSGYKSKLKTGDIILTLGYGFVSAAIRVIDKSPVTHTGFIIKEDDELFVCDLDRRTRLGSDINIEPIQSYINRHTRIIGIVPAPRALDIKLDHMRATKCRFDMSLTATPLPGRIVCTAFVYRVLKKYGNILPHDLSCEAYTTPKTYYDDPTTIMLDTTI
jgi:hypothetical protein